MTILNTCLWGGYQCGTIAVAWSLDFDHSTSSTVGKSVFGYKSFYMANVGIWSAFRVRWEPAVEYILDWVEIRDPMTALSSMRAYVMVIWPLSRLQEA